MQRAFWLRWPSGWPIRPNEQKMIQHADQTAMPAWT
jgi:hypothetical protein